MAVPQLTEEQQRHVIRIARSYIGTPYLHQGHYPQLGMDCIGLVRRVLEDLGMTIREVSDYGTAAEPEKLKSVLARYLIAMDDWEPGLIRPEPADVVLLVVRHQPQHTAFITDVGTMIHAYSSAKDGVTENSFNQFWRDRVAGVYRINPYLFRRFEHIYHIENSDSDTPNHESGSGPTVR